MSGLSDYQINLRLAEIAGVDVFPQRVGRAANNWQYEDCLKVDGRYGMGRNVEWSPLTDGSQLVPLMEAHVISVQDVGGSWRVWCGLTEQGVEVAEYAPDLKRAICLAIIAAHEEDEG